MQMTDACAPDSAHGARESELAAPGTGGHGAQEERKDTWHFCTNCSQWPTSDYVTGHENSGGEKCNECRVKKAAGDCSAG